MVTPLKTLPTAPAPLRSRFGNTLSVPSRERKRPVILFVQASSSLLVGRRPMVTPFAVAARKAQHHSPRHCGMIAAEVVPGPFHYK